MGKVVQCPVKRFEGSVTLRDPMTYELVARWEEGLAIINSSAPEDKFATIERTMYPLVIAMVEKWELANVGQVVTVENFPNASAGTSAASIHALTAWLIGECQNVYAGNEGDDPNA